MNYNKLSNLQAELDLHINSEKSLNHSDYTLEKTIALQVEFGELLNEVPTIFKYWSNKPNNREKALIEYVDGYHFLLSIGNDFGVKDYEYTHPGEYDLRKLVLGIGNMISRLMETRHFKQLMDHYLLLCEKLGFTEEQIEKAYLDKNKVNHERQNNGY